MIADVVTPMRMECERYAVVAEARSWLGTAFHHAAAVKGAGVDCAHLAAAVYTACGVIDPPVIGFYGEQWYLHESTERLQAAVAECCVKVEMPAMGDLALFQFGKASAHVVIVTEWPHYIHADRMRGGVTEDFADARGPMARRFMGWWSPTRWHPESLT